MRSGIVTGCTPVIFRALPTLCSPDVRRQSFPESRGGFITEALVRFLFKSKRPRLGAATCVFGLSVS